MEQSVNGRRVWRFGAFEVDLQERELRKSGRRVKIQEQPFQLLVLLLERPGAVLARGDLQRALWPDGTFVDFEQGLNTAVKKLREALGDSAEVPRFVETVARRGYRFIGDVEMPVSPSPAPPRWWQRLPATSRAVGVVLTVCTVVPVFLYYGRISRPKPAQPIIIPAVTEVGEKYAPSLSPDGQQLAFAWNGGAGPYFSIYVKLIGTEAPLRLTRQESVDFNPVWSPDGHYIAFCRIHKGEAGIYMVPAIGGAERKVRDTHWEEREFYEVFWYFGRLSWSPDGKLLAFSDRASRNEPTSIFLLALDTGAVKRVTSPGLPGDYNPAFSPDGRTLAFNRGAQGVTSVYTLPLAGGAWPGPLTDATLSSGGLVTSHDLVGYGRSRFAGVTRNGCNSVRRAPNLQFEGIDWRMLAS